MSFITVFEYSILPTVRGKVKHAQSHREIPLILFYFFLTKVANFIAMQKFTKQLAFLSLETKVSYIASLDM